MKTHNVRTDGRFTLVAGGARVEVANHNLEAIGALDCRESRNLVAVVPTLMLGCWHHNSALHWASMSTGPLTDCFSTEEARVAEIAPLYEHRIGTVRPLGEDVSNQRVGEVMRCKGQSTYVRSSSSGQVAA